MQKPAAALLEKLNSAVEVGDAEGIRAALAAGVDPNTRLGEQTLLHLAALAGHDAAVLALLEGGADADELDAEGYTALDLALESLEFEEGAFDPEASGGDIHLLSPAVLDRLAELTTRGQSLRGDVEEWEDSHDVGEIPALELPLLNAELSAYYDPRATAARLAAAAEERTFRAALSLLAERCGSEPRQGRGPFEFLLEPAEESPLLTAGAFDLEALQQEFLARQALVLQVSSQRGEAHLAILPTADPLEALAVYAAGDLDDELSSSRLLELFRSHPAKFETIQPRLVVGRFEKPPANPWAVAVELYNLCPNITIPLGGGLEALIESLSPLGAFRLDWS